MIAAVVAVSPGHAAQPAVGPSTVAAPSARYYLISLADQPVREVAGQVLAESLALSISVDDDVVGMMSFDAHGSFTADELEREFALAAWSRNLALVRSVDGNRRLIDQNKLGGALAAGASLVASPPSPPSRATRESDNPARPPIRYGHSRAGRQTPLVFVLGVGTGAACVIGLQAIRRRRRLRLPSPVVAAGTAPQTEPVLHDEFAFPEPAKDAPAPGP